MKQAIIYTQTDEAPALATYSLLPIIKTFVDAVGVGVETRDISVAGRILGAFPERLSPQQRVPDDLAELSKLVLQPDANIIKLPNISASLPQLRAAIAELQQQGYDIPNYPEEPHTEEEISIRERYDRIKGSAVNPVLREGNSDRRAPRSVKEYARIYPHSMGAWTPDSKSHVASMQEGDYFGSEKSTTVAADGTATICFVPAGEDEVAEAVVLKDGVKLNAGEVIDAAVMRRAALREFLAKEIQSAKEQGVLFSVHLKATMMKVSDPIIFGHVVSVFFQDVFEKYAGTFERLRVSPNNGLGDLLARIESLPEAEQAAIKSDIELCLSQGPEVSMVDSDRGITNFHVPSDFIIDATMPAAIRASGQTWGPDGRAADTKFVIPDRSYAGVYQTVIEDCKRHGAFDPRTMGSVPNVGLMAQKAEEYGSHDKTFEITGPGRVEVLDQDGQLLLEQAVATGDIFRMCQVKDAAVRDWVRLAVERARLSSTPAVFWLDEQRAHDAELIKKVNAYLPEHDTTGLDIRIMAPAAATQLSVDRARRGEDTISVTGNVLRDYLTDLFPILEVGTSAKMLSIVPLMKGGGLFETGAGGSAPKHVQQMVKEGHLRWDSLGEFLALAVSLEHLARAFDNQGAQLLAETLDRATGEWLKNGKSPSRKVKELDNRGSHYYLALYWSRAMAETAENAELKQRFNALAQELGAAEEQILKELEDAQGAPVDLGGYYRPDHKKAEVAMRPSATLNTILSGFSDVSLEALQGEQ
ncbi:MAG: NADP-dependent isocitrate dehydrogenase [Spirochaetaceae bacterium]|nr:MAG: NADP-dependent isocitrate dehydrogenase [Spirochaetaceae bacterium]